MKLASLDAIFAALSDAEVRYLVAGGVAVNAHGYQRLTVDLDLVVQLDHDNVLAAMRALSTLGYRPSVPVTGEQFAEATNRQQWIEQKDMRVLNLWSDIHRETPLNVFVTEPFDFETEYEAALLDEVKPGLEVRFVSIPMLIAMKKAVARPRDLDDIQHLQWILEAQDMDKVVPDDWETATWDGSRRAQLRHALSLTIRQRLEGLEQLAEINRHFQRMRAERRKRTGSQR